MQYRYFYTRFPLRVHLSNSAGGTDPTAPLRIGEMIVRKPFPSMLACFWGDLEMKLYRASYFERFSNVDVSAQHDWMSFNPWDRRQRDTRAQRRRA